MGQARLNKSRPQHPLSKPTPPPTLVPPGMLPPHSSIQAPKVSQVVQRSAAVPDDLQARLIRDFEATLNKSRPQHPLSKPTPPPTLVPPSPVAASSPSSSATASD